MSDMRVFEESVKQASKQASRHKRRGKAKRVTNLPAPKPLHAPRTTRSKNEDIWSHQGEERKIKLLWVYKHSMGICQVVCFCLLCRQTDHILHSA